MGSRTERLFKFYSLNSLTTLKGVSAINFSTMSREKVTQKLLTPDQEKNIINAFNAGEFTIDQLDALNEFDGIISPKEIALSLIRNWMDANKHNPFIAKEDKKQNELNLSAIRFFVQIIDDTQTV